MTRLLLDTHIWIWSLIQPEKLGKKVAATLENPESELWLSPLSIWEVVLLVERRRLSGVADAGAWLDQALAVGRWTEAPLTFQICREAERLRLEHRDPIDRLLAATAVVYGLTLVTADKYLLAAPQITTLPNK